MRLRPEFRIQDSFTMSSMTLFLGGMAMIFGARLAGGCTSGHGISGMSMLALSSIYTVLSMFAFGTCLGALLYR
jgi:uncharacterized membrane protein YedE/YeeE